VKYATQTSALLAAGAGSFLLYVAMYWYVSTTSKLKTISHASQAAGSEVTNYRTATPLR